MLCFIVDSKVQQRGNLPHQQHHLMYEHQDLHHFWNCFHVTRDESHFCMQPEPRFIHTRLILDLAQKQVSYKFLYKFLTSFIQVLYKFYTSYVQVLNKFLTNFVQKYLPDSFHVNWSSLTFRQFKKKLNPIHCMCSRLYGKKEEKSMQAIHDNVPP